MFLVDMRHERGMTSGVPKVVELSHSYLLGCVCQLCCFSTLKFLFHSNNISLQKRSFRFFFGLDEQHLLCVYESNEFAISQANWQL